MPKEIIVYEKLDVQTVEKSAESYYMFMEFLF
jgi:hypothetical protein